MKQSHFSNDEISQLTNRIRARRLFLERTRANLQDEAHDLTIDATGEISRISTHPADLGSLESSFDVTMDILERVSRELTEIHDSEIRLNAGSIGLCLECENEIPFARLMAIPEASLCGSCQEAYETKVKFSRHQQQLNR